MPSAPNRASIQRESAECAKGRMNDFLPASVSLRLIPHK